MKKHLTLAAALLLAGQYSILHAQQPILVKDINAGGGAATPKYFTEYNSKLYFQAFDSTSGTELWATDGTEAGTALVKDINPGTGSSNPQEFKVFNGKLYFQADNGVDTIRTELWVSDGTEAGTYMLKRINTNNFSTLGSLPAEFTEYNGKLYFRARDNGGGGTGDELWVTDGTEAGTQLVKDIWPGSESGYPTRLTVYNNKLYFAAGPGTPNTELYVSDGTEAGTYMLKDINIGNSGNPRDFQVYNGKLYFSADDETHGRELWVTDGSEAGTVMFRDFYIGTQDGNAHALRLWNNKLYFISGDAGGNNSGLWETDGTQAGTRKINTAAPVTTWGIFDIYFPYNGKLLFSAANSAAGDKLYQTDATEAGTAVVKSINTTDNFGDNIRHTTEHNGRVYLSADDRTGRGRQLWVTDGTADSTFIILPSDGYLNNALPYNNEFVDFNGYLFYTANYKSATGLELYKITLPPPQPPTGIGNTAPALAHVSLWPNPVKEELTITVGKETKSCTVTLVNVTGAVVYTGQHTGPVMHIDTRKFAKGVYVVHVQSEEGKQYSTKLVKK